jgi:DNA-binding NarL/FixJ family response regulator
MKPPAVAVAAAEDFRADSGHIRVLVVDDDPLVLQSLRDWLEAHPQVEVFDFASAEEAITQSNGCGYDVCLLDYRLGGLNGVMLGAMIRALNPGARLILMSGVLNPNIERQALEHGFYCVLAKPFPPRKLSELILEKTAA